MRRNFPGSFALQRSGSYVVQVAEAREKTTLQPLPNTGWKRLEDGVPKVTITRPMRDVRATSVEEVFSEIKAEDDIGVVRLELHYSVNGAPEKDPESVLRKGIGTLGDGLPHVFPRGIWA